MTKIFAIFICGIFVFLLILNAVHFRPVISFINNKLATASSDKVNLSGGSFGFSLKNGLVLNLYGLKFTHPEDRVTRGVSAELERVSVAASLHQLILGRLELNTLAIQGGNVKFYDRLSKSKKMQGKKSKNNKESSVKNNAEIKKNEIDRLLILKDVKVKIENIRFLHLNARSKKLDQFAIDHLAMEIQAKNLENLLENFSVRSQVIFKPAILKVENIKGQLAGGRISGNFSFESSKLPAKLRFKIKSNGLDFGAIIGGLNLDNGFSGGSFNSDISLEGQGKSLQELIANLSGKTSVVLQQAQFYPSIENPFVASIVKFLVGGNEKDGMKLHCLISSFKGENGSFKSQALVIDSASSFVVGEGDINLAKDSIDITVTPQGKALNLSSLVTPFKISGKLDSPTVLPDTKSTLWTVGKYVLGSVTGVGLIAVLGSTLANNIVSSVSDVCKDTLDKVKMLNSK
ncbi:AsmA-like C-terminal region-containing protein [Piscirickettsia litoralis]|uniref:AsmA-like C-terminal domain-containing protein n=1 Tax=Piscirickettsia litoralis TaxID=1891921 RepID=A0ABX3A762_9GAMM|nr:AsmA-like C-terminal region-containing protein [Piscirickettsia litoralis]ODN43463.1 hypothetical protein BGC07_11700 [Piscirickettsia litoralis]